MYFLDDFLAEVYVTREETEKTMMLPTHLPVGRIHRTGGNARVSISQDGKEYREVDNHGGHMTARFLKVEKEESMEECRVRFFTGAGYWASQDVRYTETFLKNRENGWAGGDGINSFNLTDGNDAYNANSQETLFIFGDTLVSKVDENHQRMEPVEMPNNTYALMKGDLDEIEFVIEKDEDGHAKTALVPEGNPDPHEEWFWLQDGVVIGDKLYLSPLIMNSDMGRPEGWQFKVKGVCIVEIPIIDKRPEFSKSRQIKADLYRREADRQYVGGIAYMPYHPDMGYPHGDGYIYGYGYISSLVNENGRPQMIVGRVRPEEFTDTANWRFYNGRDFVPGIENGVSVLEHISCEMSVVPITAGINKGKFLAVFQYDGKSPYVGYAIGETPWGPFAEANRVYECDEKKRVNETVYTYNAKAHSHLSTPYCILASYNVNSPSMKENCRTADIYHPRFIRLHDTTIQEGIL